MEAHDSAVYISTILGNTIAKQRTQLSLLLKSDRI